MSTLAEKHALAGWLAPFVPPRLSPGEEAQLFGQLEQLRAVLRPVRDGLIARGDPAYSDAVMNLLKWSEVVGRELGLDFVGRVLNSAETLLGWVAEQARTGATDDESPVVARAIEQLQRYFDVLRPYLPRLLAETGGQALPELPDSVKQVALARARCELALLVVLECLYDEHTALATRAFWRARLEEETQGFADTFREAPRWSDDLRRWLARRPPLRLVKGAVPTRADVVVLAPDNLDLWLIAEVRRDVGQFDDAAATLKRAMLQRRCPAGLLATPLQIAVYRDTYAGNGPESIERVGVIPTPTAWPSNDPTPSEAVLTSAITHWLMQLASGNRDALPADAESLSLVEQHVLPWVLDGRVVSEST